MFKNICFENITQTTLNEQEYSTNVETLLHTKLITGLCDFACVIKKTILYSLIQQYPPPPPVSIAPNPKIVFKDTLTCLSLVTNTLKYEIWPDFARLVTGNF